MGKQGALVLREGTTLLPTSITSRWVSPATWSSFFIVTCLIWTSRACTRPEGSWIFLPASFPQMGYKQTPGIKKCFCLGTQWFSEKWGHLVGHWEQRVWRQPVYPTEHHLPSQPVPAAQAGSHAKGWASVPFALHNALPWEYELTGENRGFWGTECYKIKTINWKAYTRQSKRNT